MYRLDIPNNKANDLAWLKSKLRPSYEDTSKKISMVDLFSGCGGLSLGVAEAFGVRPATRLSPQRLKRRGVEIKNVAGRLNPNNAPVDAVQIGMTLLQRRRYQGERFTLGSS